MCLRGGTALKPGFLNLPRLSVDVDLDCVGSKDSADAPRRHPDLLREFTALAESLAYAVAEERPSYAMAHLRLGYMDGSGRAATLKADLNFLDRVPVLPPRSRWLRHPFGDDLSMPTVQMLQFPDLVSSKLVALPRRQLARDLFDAALIAGSTTPDHAIVRTVLVVRGAGYPPPTEYSIDVVRRVTSAAWKSQVLALARRPCPVTLGGAQTDAVGLLGRVLDLEQGHLNFLKALADGEIWPETPPLDGIHDHVRANPALQWRLQTGAEALEER